MKTIFCLAILMGLLACDRDAPPADGGGSGATPQATATPQSTATPQATATPQSTTQTATAAQVTWLFIDKQMTVGKAFGVRVDVRDHIGEQLNFTVEKCGDFFIPHGDDDDWWSSVTAKPITGTVGSVGYLIVLSETGQKTLPSSCMLRATVIKRADGEKGDSFTHALKLSPARFSLSGVDWNALSSGAVTATVKVTQRPLRGALTREYVSFLVFKCGRLSINEKGGCDLVGETEMEEGWHLLPDNGVVTNLPLTDPDSGDAVRELAAGNYRLMAMYGQKGGGVDRTIGMTMLSKTLP